MTNSEARQHEDLDMPVVNLPHVPAHQPRETTERAGPADPQPRAAATARDAMDANDNDVLLALGEGRVLKRIGPQQRALNAAQRGVISTFLGTLQTVPPELYDWRSQSAARAAISLAPGISGTPFGKLAIVRTGGCNFAPSAAYVFRVAQYSERTVVAYQNSTDPTQNVLRELTEIDGVPVPASLRGKLFAIGSAAPAMAGLATASDNFIAQLAQMRRQKALLGVDPLESRATVIGHSEGGVDATLTRKRLTAAGLTNAFGTLVLAGSGVHFPEDMPLFRATGSTVVPALKALGPAPDADEIMNVARDQRLHLPAGSDALVDLSVAGRIGPKAGWRLRFGIPPFAIVDPNNIKPAMRAIALGLVPFGGGLSVDVLRGADMSSDGMVPNSASAVGKDHFVLSRPHDHVGLFEDPWVVDQIAARLPAKSP